MEDIFKQVLTARVYDLANRTPLDHALQLSQQTGNHVFLKREDLQPCFSFKIRGAYNRISHLSSQERERGVICVSAGNHAQGVALSARHLGISAIVVMPNTAPQIKVQAVRNMGGEVVLHGDSYSDAAEHCKSLVESTGRVFIPPFNDALVIAGQGTIGHEILQQNPDVQAVFVPIGGGGLIAGIGSFIKTLRPQTRIIGVEPEDSNAMQISLRDNKRVVLEQVGLFADGVAVKQVGDITYDLVKKCVDEVITVSTDQICSAIKSIYTDTRSIMEPAGALAVAGLKKLAAAEGLRDQTLVAVNSGANMNFDRLQFVAERTLTGEQLEAIYAVTIPEKPGALRFFCDKLVGDRSITEFNYRLAQREEAHIFVGIAIRTQKEKAAFEMAMTDHGFDHTDLTDNELAKSHIRHMVGGRSTHTNNEVLYRFMFPERPRALMDFLEAMNQGWNISLFHYRMHGADFGRVLVGFEIPENEQGEFQAFLEKIHYDYVEESGNSAYQLFL